MKRRATTTVATARSVRARRTDEATTVADSTDSTVSRRSNGTLLFSDFPEFQPNLTPKQVLQAGSFGGTYFRPMKSAVTKEIYQGSDWKEFPADWFTGLDAETQLSSPSYLVDVNKYHVKSGQTLEFWEEHGWIVPQDPRGWFQWYCRFYLGRRSEDDARQISRWIGVCGPKGRWKRNLVNKCIATKKQFDDASVAPVVRQLLLHWGYELTKDDFDKMAKTVQ